MTKDKTYIFHSDPGHGWLAVKRKELNELDIIDKISSFSYQKGNTVYLEEDCDASLFVDAMKKANKQFSFKESYQEKTPIRYYQAFSPLLIDLPQNT